MKYNKSEFGHTNWCRGKLIPAEQEGKKAYNLLLAFDTRTLYEDEGFEDTDLETPFFSSSSEKSKQFALCK
ncbi:hypothetical protein FACS1894199_08250 [Bacteroidia bacterium]|nr:hypothetical protein FACS1894199_08250 [Bacteroidia bacterium]